METNKKFLGEKIGSKNFSRKMEKTGIVRGKILGRKMCMKNSCRMVDGKNWNSR